MREKRIAFLSFTERGRVLAEQLCAALGGRADCTRDGTDLRTWTERCFSDSSALVYIGAVGIAVRAVGPLLRSKATDPAVVAVDELGRFAVPLASGHLGGANALARRIASVCGATPVITTATDVNGVFAVDEWARIQGLSVVETERIKAVSAGVLAGEPVTVCSAFPILGEPPEGIVPTPEEPADVYLDVARRPGLCLVPQALILGVGCRRGVTREQLDRAFERFCAERNIWPQAVAAAASIDRKADEAGLLEFCTARDIELLTFTAEELKAVPGQFTASAFVMEQVGVDNVCERSAVLASGGKLLSGKWTDSGVTFALARMDRSFDWRWQDGETVCGGHWTGGPALSDK